MRSKPTNAIQANGRNITAATANIATRAASFWRRSLMKVAFKVTLAVRLNPVACPNSGKVFMRSATVHTVTKKPKKAMNVTNLRIMQAVGSFSAGSLRVTIIVE
ncbi:unnamed protein product [Soboliphyme baturini]|uniref:Major capsid protein n=1 Tax=Soboliphyme baturini TaxID=241478 RepID=A0A183ITX0_9BILA|nr:unnamed protein product [Soboliphyme baturini]